MKFFEKFGKGEAGQAYSALRDADAHARHTEARLHETTKRRDYTEAHLSTLLPMLKEEEALKIRERALSAEVERARTRHELLLKALELRPTDETFSNEERQTAERLRQAEAEHAEVVTRVEAIRAEISARERQLRQEHGLSLDETR